MNIPALGNHQSGQMEIICPEHGNHSDSELFALGFIQTIYLSHRYIFGWIDTCYVYLVRIMHYPI